MLRGSFQLRSGATSDTYFDKYLFESDPSILKDVAERLAERVPESAEIVAGLEMGGIPIATMLSQVIGIPSAFVRKSAKDYGTCKYAEGPSLQDKAVVIIEDVVSSGGAILDAVAKLREDGITPLCVVCVIDRESGGFEKLESAGLELRSLFTMQEIKSAE